MQGCCSIRSLSTCKSQWQWCSGTTQWWVVTSPENLPVNGSATRCGPSFSFTPNTQLRVLSQPNVHVFLDEEEELTARSTGKGLTVAPWSSHDLIRQTLKTQMQTPKFIYSLYAGISLCINWRRFNWMLHSLIVNVLISHPLLKRLNCWNQMAPLALFTVAGVKHEFFPPLAAAADWRIPSWALIICLFQQTWV